MRKPVSPTVKLVRNVAVVAVLVGGYSPVRHYIRNFANSDPFGDLHKAPPPLTGGYLMRLDEVRIKHYDAHDLISYAHCDTVDLAADRHRFDLNGVHDALYRSKKGQFRYSARHASYFDTLTQLSADGGAHIRNADMDLKTAALNYDGLTHKLNIPGHVVGTLKGGQLDSLSIVYMMDKHSCHAGRTKWSGALASALPKDEQAQYLEIDRALHQANQTAKKTPKPDENQTDDDKPTIWNTQGDTVDFSGDPDQIATYTNAVATDGEIILIAPTVIHNRKTDVVTAKGRIQYFSAKADMVADECVIYRKEKRAVMTGHVLMFVKAKKDQDGKPKVETLPAYQPVNPDQVNGAPPAKVTDEEKKQADENRDSKSLRQYPTVVVSDKVEYWYAKGARRAVITGSPQARQELTNKRWRDIWTNVGYYDGEKETLKMVSSKGKRDTRMKNSIGDDVTAEWMLVSTKEDSDRMSGGFFVGQLTDLNNDEVPRDDSKPGAKPPAATPPANGQTTPVKTGGGNSVS